MIKSVIIFQKINDPDSFEEYLVNQILPEFLKAPNLTRIQITNYNPPGFDTPENLKPIQIIVDLYWESIDAMQSFIETPGGAKVSALVMNNSYSEAGAFMCKEAFFVPENNFDKR